MMNWKKLLWGLLIFLTAGAGFAQEGPVGPPLLQFSFSNPGARSMGFGGAFVALADDATAAFANPAGLVQLIEPEISMELRRWNYSTPYVYRGRVQNRPSGFGIDNVAGVQGRTSSDDVTGVSFLSFVYPKAKWSIAFYRHELANFESLTETNGLFYGGTDCCQQRFNDQRTSTDLEIVGYGVSGAYQVTETLSLGGGLVYFDGTLDLFTDTFWIDDDTVEAFFSPNSYLSERLVSETDLFFDDSDVAFNVGLLWSMTRQWRLGGFYRQGPEFTVNARRVAGALDEDGIPEGTVTALGSSPISFPDVFGLGLSWQSADGRWTVGFEWDRVQYSAILGDLDADDFDVGDISLEDGNEYHLGTEYAFLGSTPVAAIRFGIWSDPDHRASHDGRDDILQTALLPQGDNQFHYALGFGLSFERFQLDFAADFSELVNTLSVSGIYRF